MNRLGSPTLTGPLVYWVECLPMARKTGAQSQIESYQRLKNSS